MRTIRRVPGTMMLALLPLLVLTSSAAPAGGPPGGPVIIGGDEADGRGGFNDCAGCGRGNERDGDCTNTCFLQDCDDPSRTVRVEGDGQQGGSCRQFDGNQVACERAWYVTGQDEIPASCFFCTGTDGQCGAAGECRGCGSNNLRSGVCTNTCTPGFCEDVARTNALGGPDTNACRQFDHDQSSCEQAWHVTEEGLPASCFFCLGGEGACDTPGECRGCGRSNARNGACTNTCLTCADPTRTTLSLGSGQSGGACQAFDGDAGACLSGWHLTQAGLPASCFLQGNVAGNSGGWKYIEEGFDAIGPKVANGNMLAVCLGCNDEPDTADSASGAFESGFDQSALPGMGWTRIRLTEGDDLEGFFDDTGATKISQAGIIYMPSDDDNVRGGIGGAAGPCRGCGATREVEGECTDACGPPPTCLDGARTIAAGGPHTGACQQFQDEATCLQAWHRNKFDVAATCFWNGSGCQGCGRNSGSACSNTCVPAPTCADAGRTNALGGPGFDANGACSSLGTQPDCEQAWHVTGAFKGASCFWTTGSDCRTCSPKNEQGGLCTNTCGSETPTCDDPSRSQAPGAPGGNVCQQFDGDPEACNAAWHVTRGGNAASCFATPDQIGIVNANAAALGDFVRGGGGLFTHTQDGVGGGWDWLRTLLPGVVAVPDDGCQDELVHATAAGAATFPDLDGTTLCEITRSRTRFEGDFGGLHVLGAGDCTAPVVTCVDPARTTFVQGGGQSGGVCRSFDGDQAACEQAWHITDSDSRYPASCFFCTSDDGRCTSGQCRGCGPSNQEDGLCQNACLEPSQRLCLDETRTILAQEEDACRQFAGDANACRRAWHFDDRGTPSSCFVCANDDDQCDGPGDCRGCGHNNREEGRCENTCAAAPLCRDRKRKTFAGADQNRACRQFDGNRKACEKAWHVDDEGVPTTCFFCVGTEGKCRAAGECRGCGPENARAKACTDTCGTPSATAVLLGGCPVTFEPALDHFEGYKLKKAPKLEKNCHLLLDDTVSTGWDGATEYTVSKVAALLAPADKTEKAVPPTLLPQPIPALDDLLDEATHLVGYAMKRKKGAGKHAKRQGVLTVNQFGTLRFDTAKEDRFLAVALKDFDVSPPMPDGSAAVDHYKCYKIKVAKAAPGSQQDAKGKFQKRQAILVDQFESGRRYVCQPGSPANVGGACKDDKKCGGAKAAFDFCGPGEGHPAFDAARVYDLKKPTRYCVPVEKQAGTATSCAVAAASVQRPDVALTCYQKKLASKDGLTGKEKIDPKQQKHVKRPVLVHSWIAEHAFSTNKEEELCVPSTTVALGNL